MIWACSPLIATVIIPQMPKGVEHVLPPNTKLAAMDCDHSSDAERR